MNISELVAVLGKVSQVAGDIPVILHDLEADVQTEVKSLELTFDPHTGSPSSVVSIAHGPAAPAPAPVENNPPTDPQ